LCASKRIQKKKKKSEAYSPISPKTLAPVKSLHELLLGEGKCSRRLDVNFLTLEHVDELELLLEGAQELRLFQKVGVRELQEKNGFLLKRKEKGKKKIASKTK